MNPVRAHVWIVLALAVACGGDKGSSVDSLAGPPVAGPPFPALTLRGLDGSAQAVDAYDGDPVVIHFWATWCEPCVREMPLLADVQRRYSERGLRVAAVSIDDDASAVRSYLEQHRFPFDVYWDPGKEAHAACGVSVVPTSFILDSKGQVVERIEGELDWTNPDVVDTLERLLPRASKG